MVTELNGIITFSSSGDDFGGLCANVDRGFSMFFVHFLNQMPPKDQKVYFIDQYFREFRSSWLFALSFSSEMSEKAQIKERKKVTLFWHCEAPTHVISFSCHFSDDNFCSNEFRSFSWNARENTRRARVYYFCSVSVAVFVSCVLAAVAI